MVKCNSQQTQTKIICPRLPPICELRFRHWATGEWGRYKPLVRFVRETQCQVVAGAFNQHIDRRYSRRLDYYFPIHLNDDDLYLLTAAGVPLATLGLNWLSKPAYISAMCAITNSGGGTLMLDYVKKQTKHLRVEATAFSLEFWVRNRFEPMAPTSLLLECQDTSR